MNQDRRLSLHDIRKAKAGDGGGFKQGKPAMFPNKRPGLLYLTDGTKARLVLLAKNAGVSQSDLLEVLIRRYGLQAVSDIQAAGGTNGSDTAPITPAAG